MGFIFCHGISAKPGIVIGFFSFYDKNFFNATHFVKYLNNLFLCYYHGPGQDKKRFQVSHSR